MATKPNIIQMIGSNKWEVRMPTGTIVLFSYSTPVAAQLPDGSLIRTRERYSVTTSRHINKWLDGRTAKEVDQAAIDCLFWGNGGN